MDVYVCINYLFAFSSCISCMNELSTICLKRILESGLNCCASRPMDMKKSSSEVSSDNCVFDFCPITSKTSISTGSNSSGDEKTIVFNYYFGVLMTSLTNNVFSDVKNELCCKTQIFQLIAGLRENMALHYSAIIRKCRYRVCYCFISAKRILKSTFRTTKNNRCGIENDKCYVLLSRKPCLLLGLLC